MQTPFAREDIGRALDGLMQLEQLIRYENVCGNRIKIMQHLRAEAQHIRNLLHRLFAETEPAVSGTQPKGP